MNHAGQWALWQLGWLDEMVSTVLWVVATAVCVYILYYVWSRHGTRPAARTSRVPLGDAFRSAHGASNEQLARACTACERLVKDNAKDHAALYAWGQALFYLGEHAPGVEKDRLYSQAQEKYAAALALVPNNSSYAVALSVALARRGSLHRGEKANSLLVEACEICEAVVERSPRDAYALQSWTWALHCRGSRAPDALADSFLALAEEKCSLMLAIKRGDEFSVGTLGHVLVRRARLHRGEERNKLILRASELVENALVINRWEDWHLFSTWAYVLFARNAYMPGEVTSRLLVKADHLFETASKAGAERDAFVAGWGVVHWARAKTLQGDESRQLFERAKEELIEDAALGPGHSAYNVACICAELGEIQECRHWLEQSQEPGGCVSRDQMETERELETVREFEWFRELLGKGEPGGKDG